MTTKLLIVIRPVAGGMWQHLLTLLDGLGDAYDPVVCCQDDPEQLALLAANSIPARVVPMPPTIQPIEDYLAGKLLRRVIIEEKPSLVHTHGFHAGILADIVIPHAGDPPHVCTLHSMAVQPGASRARTSFYNVLQRILVSKADRVIAVSNAVKEALPGKARPPKVVVIPNGIDPRKVTPKMSAAAGRRKLRLKKDVTVIGCVARLAAEKGVDDFLRMGAVLAEKEIPVRFLVVGDGPMREELQALAADLDLEEKVTFVGEHFPAADFMQLFDVTIVPSISEGQSLVAIESLFLGIPVIATSVGGLTEVVTPDVGKLVPPRQPQELARAASGLLSSGEAKRLGARGREAVLTRFTSERMVAETKAVYEEAVSAKRRTA